MQTVEEEMLSKRDLAQVIRAVTAHVKEQHRYFSLDRYGRFFETITPRHVEWPEDLLWAPDEAPICTICAQIEQDASETPRPASKSSGGGGGNRKLRETSFPAVLLDSSGILQDRQESVGTRLRRVEGFCGSRQDSLGVTLPLQAFSHQAAT